MLPSLLTTFPNPLPYLTFSHGTAHARHSFHSQRSDSCANQRQCRYYPSDTVNNGYGYHSESYSYAPDSQTAFNLPRTVTVAPRPRPRPRPAPLMALPVAPAPSPSPSPLYSKLSQSLIESDNGIPAPPAPPAPTQSDSLRRKFSVPARFSAIAGGQELNEFITACVKRADLVKSCDLGPLVNDSLTHSDSKDEEIIAVLKHKPRRSKTKKRDYLVLFMDDEKPIVCWCSLETGGGFDDVKQMFDRDNPAEIEDYLYNCFFPPCSTRLSHSSDSVPVVAVHVGKGMHVEYRAELTDDLVAAGSVKMASRVTLYDAAVRLYHHRGDPTTTLSHTFDGTAGTVTDVLMDATGIRGRTEMWVSCGAFKSWSGFAGRVKSVDGVDVILVFGNARQVCKEIIPALRELLSFAVARTKSTDERPLPADLVDHALSPSSRELLATHGYPLVAYRGLYHAVDLTPLQHGKHPVCRFCESPSSVEKRTYQRLRHALKDANVLQGYVRAVCSVCSTKWFCPGAKQ